MPGTASPSSAAELYCAEEIPRRDASAPPPDQPTSRPPPCTQSRSACAPAVPSALAPVVGLPSGTISTSVSARPPAAISAAETVRCRRRHWSRSQRSQPEDSMLVELVPEIW